VFTVERRTLPGETLEHVEADIAALIERCRPADPRLTVNARTVLHRPPMETSPTAAIVQALVVAAGHGTSVAPMSYWADSAFLAAAGIPPRSTDQKAKEPTPTSNGSAAPVPAPPPPS
jgi:acetylornithine deacetylase